MDLGGKPLNYLAEPSREASQEDVMNGNAFAVEVHADSLLMESLEAPIKELHIPVASCQTCAELASLLKKVQPHLVLTEPKLTDGSWLEVVKMVRKMSPPANVLVIGSEADSLLELA